MRLNSVSRGFALAVAFMSSNLASLSVAQAAVTQLDCRSPIGPEADAKALKAEKIAAQTMTFAVSKGRSLFVQLIKPSKAGLPTLLLMPGVNRNLLLDEASGQALAHLGFGVVAFSLSTQPFSVAALPENERPNFLSSSYSLSELADEVTALSKSMLPDMKQIIPVSLSYSGALSPMLKNFPLIIETVPMTSAAAVNPQLEQYRQLLMSGEIFNPIFGPGITRASLDAAYRQTWASQVDSISREFGLATSRRSDMIEGYTVMSRATEGFAWDVKKLPTETRRIFIVAGNEAPSLQRHQLETFRAYAKTRDDAVLFVIGESGHVIPAEQPSAYACALDLALSKELKAGVVLVQPSTGKITKLTDGDADTVLAKLQGLGG